MSALRLSVLTDETTSPDRQREANGGAAAALGIDLADREAVDLGVSASKTTPFERPELGAWLRRPDDFDALCFWRFDRAVRSMDDMQKLSTWARDNRKMIVFAEGPGGRLVLDFRNPLDPMAQLMVTLFAFAAQMEAQSIRERVISAQAAMRTMSLRWRGSRPPYGYMPAPLEGGGWTLVQDPETVPVIERIMKELIDGKTAAAIATGLNTDDIPSPRDYWSLKKGRETGGKTGGKAGETVTRERFAWRHGTVKSVLTSERMLGWKTHGDKPVRDSEGRPVMATAEPIVTREEFDAIGALFAARSVDNKHTDRADTVALLLRVIECAGCGGRMYLHRPSSKSTTTTETYKCGSYTRGKPCDSRATLKRDWADEYAEREFLRLAGQVEYTETREIPGYDPAPEIEATLAEYEAHQEQQGQQKSSAGKQAWQRRADALDARLAELETRPKVEPSREIIKTGRKVADKWRDADPAGKRAMLVNTGAHLSVKRGTRGGWRTLDESRVRFTMRGELDDVIAELLALSESLTDRPDVRVIGARLNIREGATS
ncbi:recombinase family protein [Actinacidiphila oryziradicis]|uniref:Recombinase family protein n=1 Tax=Actinacidiphila oryziradicis TaxID=2571141 RepID=A0A4U0T9C0_9ACTN|nr:recombinase family protein [Actinacidiphila oryziradicis]